MLTNTFLSFLPPCSKDVAPVRAWSLCLPVCYPQNVHISVILPFLYGCETWSLILRKEHRLRVCENRILRRISGPMRDELTKYWRRQRIDELYDLFSSRNIARVIKSKRWDGLDKLYVCWTGNVNTVLERRTEGRDHLEELGVDGWIILKRFFNNGLGKLGLDCCGSG